MNTPEQKPEPQAEVQDAARRELLRKITKTAYIAPITLMLLSSEKAAGY